MPDTHTHKSSKQLYISKLYELTHMTSNNWFNNISYNISTLQNTSYIVTRRKVIHIFSEITLVIGHSSSVWLTDRAFIQISVSMNLGGACVLLLLCTLNKKVSNFLVFFCKLFIVLYRLFKYWGNLRGDADRLLYDSWEEKNHSPFFS